MVAAAFTLTNCTQEIDAPVEPSVDGVPFEIVAKSADTKTAYVGDLKTVCVEGDALNLFHAEAEGTEYENDGEFKLDGENTFKGKLAGTLKEAYCYDWYAIYPYSSYITTPANTSYGYSYFGSRSDRSQTQNGNNSMAHIAGSNYPLYGVCKNWEYYADEPVEIEMTHLTCLLEVNVTNNTAEDLLVSAVSFTAPENIVGTFYVNFAGDTPSFTDADYVSKVANLDVQNATALANGQSAKFYLAVKPFTAAANSEIALSVNGYSKKVTLPVETAFNAGEIKTLNFAYNADPGEVPSMVTWDLSVASYSNATENEVNWVSDYVNMSLVKNTSSTTANNILGGNKKEGSEDVYTETRVYKDQILSFTQVAENSIIEKIEFTATSSDYANKLKVSHWTNGVAGCENAIVTVIPEDKSDEVSVQISEATRFTSISVYYQIDPDYVFVEPTVVSIAVANPQTSYYVGEEFVEPIVYATYSSGRVDNVTDAAQFSGFNSAVAIDSQTITVNFGGKSTTYDIVIKEISGSGPVTVVLSAETKPCEGFPDSSSPATSAATYTIGDYSWTFSPSSGNKFAYYTNNGTYILWGKSGGYILLPAIEGKKLTKVTILTGKGASTSVKVGVYDETGTTEVSGGEAMQLNATNSEFSWNLSGTAENTHYQLRVTSKHNAQLQTLTLKYE